MWNLEGARAARLLDLDQVLQGMHRVEILRVVGIDECAKGHDEVARSDALPRECMAARAIEDARRVLDV